MPRLVVGPVFIIKSTFANERVHIHSVRDFPQGKLDSEINTCFLLSKHRKVPFSVITLSKSSSLPFH